MIKESAFQSKIIKYLKNKGCYVIKTGGLGTPNGCPDIIALMDGGGWFALEIKKSKDEPFQPLQKPTIAKLDRMYFSRAVYPENWNKTKKEMEMFI